VLSREGASNRVNGVVILDLATPAHPKVASTFDIELTGGVHNMFATNDHLFDEIFARGHQLSDDPLQAFLISLKLLAETMADLPSGHPGCLIASICYQERLFDREVRELTAQSVRDWNARFRGILDGIASIYPPREPVDLDDVADMLSCIVDGAIIMSKTLNDPSRLERQILIFRSCVKLMFAAPSVS